MRMDAGTDADADADGDDKVTNKWKHWSCDIEAL